MCRVCYSHCHLVQQWRRVRWCLLQAVSNEKGPGLIHYPACWNETQHSQVHIPGLFVNLSCSPSPTWSWLTQLRALGGKVFHAGQLLSFPSSALWWFQQPAETCKTRTALCCADGQTLFLSLLCQSVMHNFHNIYNIARNSQITFLKSCRTWQNQMKLKWKIAFNFSLYNQTRLHANGLTCQKHNLRLEV